MCPQLKRIRCKSLSSFYLQGLQVSFLWVAQQGGNAMIVPHAANIGVSPQREDLTDDGHPPQRAVNQLHDVCITHLLETKMSEMLARYSDYFQAGIVVQHEINHECLWTFVKN